MADEIMNDDPYYEDGRYDGLFDILQEAYDQAATGKGKERHANGQHFERQPICEINRMLGTSDGALYQAVKKIQESKRINELFGVEAAVKERLGAIVYLCASIILDREFSQNNQTEGE